MKGGAHCRCSFWRSPTLLKMLMDKTGEIQCPSDPQLNKVGSQWRVYRKAEQRFRSKRRRPMHKCTHRSRMLRQSPRADFASNQWPSKQNRSWTKIKWRLLKVRLPNVVLMKGGTHCWCEIAEVQRCWKSWWQNQTPNKWSSKTDAEIITNVDVR